MGGGGRGYKDYACAMTLGENRPMLEIQHPGVDLFFPFKAIPACQEFCRGVQGLGVEARATYSRPHLELREGGRRQKYIQRSRRDRCFQKWKLFSHLFKANTWTRCCYGCKEMFLDDTNVRVQPWGPKKGKSQCLFYRITDLPTKRDRLRICPQQVPPLGSLPPCLGPGCISNAVGREKGWWDSLSWCIKKTNPECYFHRVIMPDVSRRQDFKKIGKHHGKNWNNLSHCLTPKLYILLLGKKQIWQVGVEEVVFRITRL